MKGLSKNLFIVYAGALLFILATAECKTARSRMPQTSSKVTTEDVPTTSNVFYSVAKSLVTEALSQFQQTARRNPRLGFNITMLLPQLPGIGNNTADNNNNTTGGLANLGSLVGTGGLVSTAAQLGVVGLKGGILGLKAAIIQAIVGVLFVIFLITGMVYFACNIGIVSCSNLGGSLTNLGGGLGGGSPLSGLDPFSRAGYDYQRNLHRSTLAAYNAIDDGQKKYT